MYNTTPCIMIKTYDYNKKNGQQRMNKSLNLIKYAINILNEQQIKPTIMHVTGILKGRLGEATIKKYWRNVYPKNEVHINQLSDELLPKRLELSNNDENFIELYIKEWNITIYKPAYFSQVCNMNAIQASWYYQRQFFRHAS